MTNKKTAIGIIGAGITGLSTAYGLHKKGIPVTVYEKYDQVGGSIKTVTKHGWMIEEGPNTLMVKSERVWELLEELELHDQIVEANQKAKRRFVVKNGRPVALPSSISTLLRTPLLSAKAKLRLLKEPFIAPVEGEDETIAHFISRRLGEEPLNYGVNPFVSGVYAGDPKELSLKHTFATLWEMEQTHGSLFKGVLKKKNQQNSVKKKLLSFKDGNQVLPQTLANALDNPVHTSCTITSVKYENSIWQIQGQKNERPIHAKHDILISTLPAYQLAPIFDSASFSVLSDIYYAPLSVIALGFNKEQLHHPVDGFGMLVPGVEPFNTLGVLFSSTLFSGRAPKDHHLLTCFLGGAKYPDQAGKPKVELLEQLLPELDQLLGVEGKPVFTHHKYWPQAIPQYTMGYDRYLSTMDTLEQEYPGLFLRGNYRNGVSVPDCIKSGLTTAEEVSALL